MASGAVRGPSPHRFLSELATTCKGGQAPPSGTPLFRDIGGAFGASLRVSGWVLVQDDGLTRSGQALAYGYPGSLSKT